MEALEKAKLALRKYLLENGEKVAYDLEVMRKMSEGKDIFNYIENLSDAFSFECVTSSTEVIFDFSSQPIDCYNFLNTLIDNSLYTPPPRKVISTKIKKDSGIFSESFFFIILQNVRGTKSSIFV